MKKPSELFEPSFAHCVQCGEEMPSGLDICDKYVPICTNVACPNYGLVQVGIEKMPVESVLDKKHPTGKMPEYYPWKKDYKKFLKSAKKIG